MDRESVSKGRYDQQLKDKRWKFKSDKIRMRDNHQCRLCGARNTQLDVHHLRYIYGRKAWDYDDEDLVTLCHKCHEEIHIKKDFEEIVYGGYFYNKDLKGVGIVTHKGVDGVNFDFCWTEDEHWKENNYGRLFIGGEASRNFLRKAKPYEIKRFWQDIENKYSFEYIIRNFGEYLKTLLPENHPIRVKARNCFMEAVRNVECQKKYVKEKFDYFLLVNDDNFAMFDTNREFGTRCGWPSYEFPYAYFLVACKKDVIGKTKDDYSKKILFDEFDFSGYRAATLEEVQQWIDYLDYITSFRNELPF